MIQPVEYLFFGYLILKAPFTGMKPNLERYKVSLQTRLGLGQCVDRFQILSKLNRHLKDTSNLKQHFRCGFFFSFTLRKVQNRMFGCLNNGSLDIRKSIIALSGFRKDKHPATKY